MNLTVGEEDIKNSLIKAGEAMVSDPNAVDPLWKEILDEDLQEKVSAQGVDRWFALEVQRIRELRRLRIEVINVGKDVLSFHQDILHIVRVHYE